MALVEKIGGGGGRRGGGRGEGGEDEFENMLKIFYKNLFYLY